MTLDEELLLLREDYVKKESEIRFKYDNSLPKQRKEYDTDSEDDISLQPFLNLLKERQLSLKAACILSGIVYGSMQQVIIGKAYPKTDKIAKLACYFKVPVSSIIHFNNYEIKPEYTSKYGVILPFEVPDIPVGLPSYQPMRDLVTSFYVNKQDKKTIADLYDLVPKREREDAEELKEYIKKGLEARGIDPDNPKHERIARPGLNSSIRAKLNRDEPVTMRVIYEICKLLHCNIDFVMGWK